MNKIAKQIEDIRRDISYCYFQDTMTQKDYDWIDKQKKLIEELKKELVGKKFYIGKFIKDTHICYLGDEETLCYCDDPCYFDSKEEVMEYYNKARIGEFGKSCKFVIEEIIV